MIESVRAGSESFSLDEISEAEEYCMYFPHFETARIEKRSGVRRG